MLQVSLLSQSLAATAHPSDRSSSAVDLSLLDVTFPPDPQSGGHVTDMAAAVRGRDCATDKRKVAVRQVVSPGSRMTLRSVMYILSFSRRSERR